jgi:hypothetical protein
MLRHSLLNNRLQSTFRPTSTFVHEIVRVDGPDHHPPETIFLGVVHFGNDAVGVIITKPHSAVSRVG